MQALLLGYLIVDFSWLVDSIRDDALRSPYPYEVRLFLCFSLSSQIVSLNIVTVFGSWLGLFWTKVLEFQFELDFCSELNWVESICLMTIHLRL